MTRRAGPPLTHDHHPAYDRIRMNIFNGRVRIEMDVPQDHGLVLRDDILQLAPYDHLANSDPPDVLRMTDHIRFSRLEQRLYDLFMTYDRFIVRHPSLQPTPGM